MSTTPKKVEIKVETAPSPQGDMVTLSEAKTFDSNVIAQEHGYTVHEAARLFAMLDGAEMKALANDIKLNGQRVPIATQNKIIVDGRNRLVACEIAGVPPTFVDIDGDAVEAVISLNLQRRNLDESQKATLALRLIPKLKEEAETRKKLGKPNDPRREGGKASGLAAKMVGVSARIVQRLERIEKYAPQEIVEIEQGKKTVGEVDKVLTEHINLVKQYAKGDWEKIESGEKALDDVYKDVLEKHPKVPAKGETKKQNVLIILSDDAEAIKELAKPLPNFALLENKFRGFPLSPDEKIDKEASAPFFAAVEAYRKGIKS